MNRIRTGALCPSEGATLRVAPERRIPVRASVALTCPGMREYGRPFRRKTGKMSKRSVFGIAVLLLSLATAAACGDDIRLDLRSRNSGFGLLQMLHRFEKGDVFVVQMLAILEPAACLPIAARIRELGHGISRFLERQFGRFPLIAIFE